MCQSCSLEERETTASRMMVNLRNSIATSRLVSSSREQHTVSRFFTPRYGLGTGYSRP